MLDFATIVKNLILILTLVCGLVARPDARAQAVINSSNTIVRFNFLTGGTNFGHLDLELFDQDKPETVKNFLLYVYSGGYSNLVLQRLVPNFVMQGGYVTVPNPASRRAFASYVTGPNFGRITNEYSVGPEMSNLYGTIAMARVGGVTNSADAQFFFNLNNNTNLDAVDGGFTVFGHVVNTTGPENGTNLLNFFNTLSSGHGIRGVGVARPADLFESLPVNTNRLTQPRYRDLFVVQALVLTNGRPHEFNSPALTLDATTDLETTNESLTVSGTSGDDTTVDRILFQMPYGFVTSPGATNWSTVLKLFPGTNDFVVWSVDAFGNRSAPQKRKVFYLLYTPLHLNVDGPGHTSGPTNGQILKAGVNYYLQARPSPGKYFLGWRGDIFANVRSIGFRMSENLSVSARFSDTLLGQPQGTYHGLFFPKGSGPKSSLGWLSLNLTSWGEYNGRLAPLGASYETRGTFAPSGRSLISGEVGLDRLILVLRYVEGTEAILADYSKGHVTAAGVLFRVQRFTGTNHAVSTGRYTYLLSPTRDTNFLAGDGYGHGTMVVSPSGRITMSGKLGDGESIKQRASILQGERWPLFAPAYFGGGGVLGFGLFNSNHVIDTTVSWFNPDFPGNTNVTVRWSVSPYTPPSQARLFPWTNGVVELAEGGLAAPISAQLLLNPDGTFTIPSNTNNISLAVADETGLLTGSFTHPVSLSLTPLRGAVLQSSNIAAGYFGLGRHNGSVLIRAP